MLSDDIHSLEGQLLDRGVRASTDDLDRLLADDFVEFGSSGRAYTKAEIIAALLAGPSAGPGMPIMDEFRTLVLAPHVVLATYRFGHSLRSSLWRREVTGWRMVFHQGTRTSRKADGDPP
jgi:hypothetical protein